MINTLAGFESREVLGSLPKAGERPLPSSSSTTGCATGTAAGCRLADVELYQNPHTYMHKRIKNTQLQRFVFGQCVTALSKHINNIVTIK